jgi:hypothetical protein
LMGLQTTRSWDENLFAAYIPSSDDCSNSLSDGHVDHGHPLLAISSLSSHLAIYLTFLGYASLS